jgi:hypothetical protein
MVASLDHAHFMVRELPKWINSDNEPILKIAVLEDWLTNIHLVAEFYRISGNDKASDFSVNDFLSDFRIEKEYRTELNELWLMASKHVSHLSRERLPVENQAVEPFDDSLANLTRISSYVDKIYFDFSARLKKL